MTPTRLAVVNLTITFQTRRLLPTGQPSPMDSRGTHFSPQTDVVFTVILADGLRQNAHCIRRRRRIQARRNERSLSYSFPRNPNHHISTLAEV